MTGIRPGACAQLGQDAAVVRLQRVAVEAEQAGPAQLVGDGAGLAELVLLLVGHLEEEQVGELLDVVAVGDAVVAQDVAVVPEALDDGGGLGRHDGSLVSQSWRRGIRTRRIVRLDEQG